MSVHNPVRPVDLVAPGEPPSATLYQDPNTTSPMRSPGAGWIWVRVLPALVLLTVGLVFILQNLHHAQVSFLNLSGSIPVAVALLAAFALGALSVLLLGSIRMLQLRNACYRGARFDSR